MFAYWCRAFRSGGPHRLQFLCSSINASAGELRILSRRGNCDFDSDRNRLAYHVKIVQGIPSISLQMALTSGMQELQELKIFLSPAIVQNDAD